MNRYSDVFVIGPYGCGKTHNLAEVCKKINATMLCHNTSYAEEIANKYGIKARSIQSELTGTVGPYIADHNAILTICLEYEQEIGRLRNILRNIQRLIKLEL